MDIFPWKSISIGKQTENVESFSYLKTFFHIFLGKDQKDPWWIPNPLPFQFGKLQLFLQMVNFGTHWYIKFFVIAIFICSMKRFKNNAVFKVILRIQPFTSNVLTTNFIASQCDDFFSWCSLSCSTSPLGQFEVTFLAERKGKSQKEDSFFLI